MMSMNANPTRPRRLVFLLSHFPIWTTNACIFKNDTCWSWADLFYSKSNKKVKPYKCFQSQGQIKIAYRCNKFNGCLVVEIIQRWNLSSAKPLWPCIKVKVINKSMSMYSMHKSTGVPRFNAIAEIMSEILLLKCKLKYVSTLRHGCDLVWRSRSCHRTEKSWYRPLVGLYLQQIWWALLGKFLNCLSYPKRCWNKWHLLELGWLPVLCLRYVEIINQLLVFDPSWQCFPFTVFEVCAIRADLKRWSLDCFK